MPKSLIVLLAALALAGCATPPIMSGSSADITVESKGWSGSNVARVAADHCGRYGKRAEYVASDHIATRFACR